MNYPRNEGPEQIALELLPIHMEISIVSTSIQLVGILAWKMKAFSSAYWYRFVGQLFIF